MARLPRRLAQLGLYAAVVLVPLVHGGEAETTVGLEAEAARALGLIAGCAAVGWWLAAPPRRAGATVRLGVAYLLAAGASWLASSRSLHLAGELVSLAAAAGIVLAVPLVPLRRLAALGLAAATLAAGAALVLPAAGEAGGPGRPAGTFADAETLGLALAPVAAAAAVLAGVSRGRAVAVAALLVAAGAFASLSRGAWAAVWVGTLAGLAPLARRRGLGEAARPLALAALCVCLGALVAVASLAGTGRLDLVVRRAHVLVEYRGGVTPSRREMWQVAGRLIAEKPWLGDGPGSYPWRVPDATRRARDQGVLAAALEPWPHAQNDALEEAASVGVPGSCLLAGLWLVAIARAFRRGGEQGGAALAMLAAITASSLLHPPLHVPAGRLVAAVALGLAADPAPAGPPRGRPRLAAAVAALGLPLAAVALWGIPEPGPALARARALGRSGDPVSALVEWRLYAERSPPAPRARLRLALALEAAGESTAAEAALASLLADWPEDEAAHLALGQVFIGSGRFNRALAELSRVHSAPLAARARALEALAGRGSRALISGELQASPTR